MWSEKFRFKLDRKTKASWSLAVGANGATTKAILHNLGDGHVKVTVGDEVRETLAKGQSMFVCATNGLTAVELVSESCIVEVQYSDSY